MSNQTPDEALDAVRAAMLETAARAVAHQEALARRDDAIRAAVAVGAPVAVVAAAAGVHRQRVYQLTA